MGLNKEKSDLDRLGIFREMSYHTIKDPYKPLIDMVGNTKTHKGRPLVIGGTKEKSALSDGYFDTFKRVFVGDNRVDFGTIMRKQRISAKKLNKGKDWIPPAQLKKLDGLGSYFGTFSGPIPYLKPKSIRIQPRPIHLRNITTSCGKKGSGSYVDICLTPYPQHSVEPYDRIERMNAKERMLGCTLSGNRGPFYTSIQPITYFDSNPFRSHKPSRRSKSAGVNKNVIHTPFIPTGPSKVDGGCKDGCFGKFPSYMSGVMRKPKMTAKSAPVFRPSYGPLPYPISSIVDQNVKRAVNSANYKQVRGVVYL